jgi:hypothetical protein
LHKFNFENQEDEVINLAENEEEDEEEEIE